MNILTLIWLELYVFFSDDNPDESKRFKLTVPNINTGGTRLKVHTIKNMTTIFRSTFWFLISFMQIFIKTYQ